MKERTDLFVRAERYSLADYKLIRNVMKRYIIITSTAIAFALSAGLAFAQVVGETSPIMVQTTPVTTAPAANSSGTALGTIQLSSASSGSTYSISSLPITLTSNNGGVASDLSGCQLFNANNTALNTNANIPTVQNGSNTITFDTPLSITNTPTVLTIKCNVSSSTASGSTFEFIAGSANATLTSSTPITTTTTPAGTLSATLQTVPSVAAGSQGSALALILLNAANSPQNVTISSIPLSMTFNTAMPADFTNCSLRNATNLGLGLNTGNNAVATLGGNGSTFTFDTPLTVSSGSSVALALICDVSSATPAGSSVGITLSPGTITAAGVSGGSVIATPALMPNGTNAATFGTVEIVAPGIATTGTTSSTPGAPNTGAGGNAPQNILVLVSAAFVAILGSIYLMRRRVA
jgi:hypothetical protein